MDQLIPLPAEERRVFEAGLDQFLAQSHKRAVIQNHPREQSAAHTLLPSLGEPVSSLLIMVLPIHGQALGALVCVAHGADRYVPEHLDALDLLYEPFYIALSNALAHREIGRLRDILLDDNR